MRLAARLVKQVPDNSVTLFDRGVWSPGLLIGLPWSSPGAVPGHLKHFYSNAAMLKLPPGTGV